MTFVNNVSTTPVEEPDDEYPYCEAVAGIQPHNYQPAIDLGGSGMYSICTQCGDYFHVDGTGIQPSAPTAAPTAAPATPAGGTGTGTPGTGGFPFS